MKKKTKKDIYDFAIKSISLDTIEMQMEVDEWLPEFLIESGYDEELVDGLNYHYIVLKNLVLMAKQAEKKLIPLEKKYAKEALDKAI